MDYKQAWESLKSSLLSRGEYFFFAKGDDPNSLYKLGEVSIQTTLQQMKDLEKKIEKSSKEITQLPIKGDI